MANCMAMPRPEEDIRRSYLADFGTEWLGQRADLPEPDSANILFNVPKTTTSGGVTVARSRWATAASAHILTPAATMRRVLNMTAVAAVTGTDKA